MSNWTWKDEVYEVLKLLGGHAKLNDIYDLITQRKQVNTTNRSSMTASVRHIIEVNSSDSEIFSSKEDLFYAVSGKGSGHWGIRSYVTPENKLDLTQDDDEYAEGKIKFKQHIVRERNQELIKKAKEKFRAEHNGKLFCEVCGFDFYDVYGQLGEGFIEAHHTKPVSEMIEGEKTNIDDIAMVCSNCHSMVHRKRPWLTKEKLKEVMS